jgi:hypothetical protein
MKDMGRPRAQRPGAFPGLALDGIQSDCPPWCATEHGVHLGEEDWVHTSVALAVADGVVARLCLSVDPASGSQDGPYVLIGATEYTLAEARALGDSLMALADAHE